MPIRNDKKHKAKMELSDKFQQPFEKSDTRDMVIKFNGKQQKRTKPKKRK